MVSHDVEVKAFLGPCPGFREGVPKPCHIVVSKGGTLMASSFLVSASGEAGSFPEVGIRCGEATSTLWAQPLCVRACVRARAHACMVRAGEAERHLS